VISTNMAISITITGTDEIKNGLNLINKNLKDASEPLLESSNIYHEAILENFKDQGRTFGQKWKPISKATIAIKKKLKEQGKAVAYTIPLVRTGEMRDAFTYTLIGKNKSQNINMMEYAKKHQEGIGVPKRLLADIDNARTQKVVKAFYTWVDKILSKI